jgi:hypothetical protein
MFLRRNAIRVSVPFLLGGNRAMTSRVATVAFQGISRGGRCAGAIPPGQVQFHIVGLPDKAVAESRERVRAASISPACRKRLASILARRSAQGRQPFRSA